MRVLFVAPYAPNLIRVRPYHLIRSLLRRGHEVTVAAPWSSANERDDLDELAVQGVRLLPRRLPSWRSSLNCLTALPGSLPLQAVYSWQPALARDLQFALRASNFDVVHVEHLRGARYGLRALHELANQERDGSAARWKGRPAVIWDSVDCISHLFAQAAHESRSIKSKLVARLELGRTRQFEAILLRRFDRVLVTSAMDREALLSLSTWPASVAVLPNGVDLDLFASGDPTREPATLVLSGKMSYHANVTAALHLVRDIMPHVWARRPNVKVWIVGKDPPRQISALASSDAQHANARGRASSNGHAALAHRGRVQITGSVPEMGSYLRQATLAVAPMPYGAGIQNKVLEAMACATPVVVSPQAASALAVQPGRDLIVADGVENFAESILALLDDSSRRMQLGKAGRAFVEAHHSWDVVGTRLEEIYQSACNSEPKRLWLRHDDRH